MPIDYEKSLNSDQYQVVTGGDGPCLVLAGAGSGKTRTLVYRVAYLIEHHVNPENILLVTFTNKAAKERMERVTNLLGGEPAKLWGGTFHRIANLILRKHGNLLGYDRSFNILDEEDSISFIKNSMDELGISTRGQSFVKPTVVRSMISFARNINEEVSSVVQETYSYPDFIAKKVADIAERYDLKKKGANVMDFDDLLLNWLKLLTDFPEIKEKYGRQFQYILVDEYQDTNFVQAAIIRELAEFNRNVLVVGDDSQSIYSFRAADVKNILNFPEIFQGAKIYRIEKNYRSTPQILSLANNSIKNNQHQFEKKLQADKDDGNLPTLIAARDDAQQASVIVRKIMEFYRNGLDYGSFAVLYRANYQSAELQLQLSRQNIPYVVRGGQRYFEQAHIKDVVAYLKVFSNFQDEIAWKRILPLYDGIGLKGADKIWLKIKEFATFRDMLAGEVKLTGKSKDGFVKVLLVLRNMSMLITEQKGTISEAVDFLLNFNYTEHLKNSFDNWQERQDDLQQFMSFVSNYTSLENLLADVLLSEDFSKVTEQKTGSVVLSTIHQAKGLEWAVVFIIGLRDGHFPHQKSLENEKQLEEERRLFYVAVTRAKDELYLLYPIRSFSYKYGEQLARPSTFIRELDKTKYMTEQSRSGWQDKSSGGWEEETIYVD